MNRPPLSAKGIGPESGEDDCFIVTVFAGEHRKASFTIRSALPEAGESTTLSPDAESWIGDIRTGNTVSATRSVRIRSPHETSF